MFGVEPKPDIHAVIQKCRKTFVLVRAIENDMIRNLDDFGHVGFFIASAISRDLALIIIAGKARFPQA